jgi:hypothetical protein
MSKQSLRWENGFALEKVKEDASPQISMVAKVGKMSARSIKRLYFTGIFSSLILLLGTITGCASGPDQPGAATPTAATIYQLAPIFREYYEAFGGASVLGEPISQMVEQAGRNYQFTAAALWVLDNQAPDGQKFRFAPLGMSIISSERMDPPQPPPAQPDPYYVNGQYVYQPFRSLYDRLGGETFVGRPLTGVRYDALNDRYEQYFENLGFYIGTQEGAQAGLLHYGAWLCDNQCRSPKQVNGAIQHVPELKPPFDAVVAQLGRDLTGEPLAMAAQGPDGRLEQVFTNLVLVADANDPLDPDLVAIRPIVEQLNILPAPLAPPSAEGEAYFFEVNAGLGYNIPGAFKDFIDRHGGFGIIGEPLNELSQINARVARQCFRNLCLDMDPTAPAHLQIRPAPLGVDYLKANLQTSSQPTAETHSFQQLTVQVWEAQEQVASDQEQEIWASISENGQPLANIRPLLVLNLPDGSQLRYDMPATGGDGRTSLQIPPIAAANGMLIPYELCVPQGEQMFCTRQEYLILNLP